MINFAYVVSAHKGILPTVRSMITYTVPMMESGRPINAKVLPVLAFLFIVLREFLLLLLMASEEKTIPANGIKDNRIDSKPKIKARFASFTGS